MYIYFNIPDGDFSKVPFTEKCGTSFTIFDKVAKWSGPNLYYVEVDDGAAPFLQMEELVSFFLRATIKTYPNFHMLHGPTMDSRARAFGVYSLGKAKAELLPNFGGDSGRNYMLSVETTSWDGLGDMKKLQHMLWAGVIVPDVPYDCEQRKIHPLDVLRRLLSSRKLNRVQRFFLAVRMLQ